ncbi:MAG TPA: zf-HC2 domain-containing protein [Terriglobales bacterium]|nr:zf-HC2 domain-containing protein [Terriglobales bacterium]
MKCSDVDRILPDLIDGAPIGENQDLEVQSHLRTCAECSDLVADLKLIASEARQLSDCEDPSPRVWVRIANELRAEGLIKEHEAELPRPVPVPAARRRWNPFWLAPVAAAILAAGSYLLIHHPAHHAVAQVAKSSVPQTTSQVAQQMPTQQLPAQPAQPSTQEVAKLHPSPAAPRAAAPSTSATADATEEAELTPPVSDNQFLSEVSTRAPGMRSTYANELQAVNNEIRETKAYIVRHPGDVDARQHLLDVYQQKVMLYQMALDRIQ